MDKTKIMIVEDEGIVAHDIARQLTDFGYEVVATAYSGEEAIDKARELHPDLVLMDIVLAGRMDGIETADIIRSRWDIPIVFLTAYADQKRLERAKQVNPLGYILKPFQGGDLKVAVEMALHISTANRERRMAEEKLRASEVRHRTIIQAAMNGFWLADAQGHLLEVNETYCRMSGYSEAELLTMNITDLEAAESAAETLAHIQKIMAQDKDHFESRHRRKDGTLFNVEVSVQYHSAGGGYFLVFLQDITEYKIAANKLLETVHQLQEATDLLVYYEKQTTIARFAAGIAHEILNPTTIISSRLQMMEATNNLSGKVQESLKICQDQIKRIVKISRDLYQAAHQNPVRRKSIDIGALIQKVLIVMETTLQPANVQYSLSIPPAMQRIALDPDKVERLMINLVFNAIDAMEGKKEKILKIAVQPNADPQERHGILISVTDNGTGIKEEYLPKIFDPFFTTKSPGKGTGLGLSVCNGIIREHGGKIWVENHDAGGTVFYIWLPCGSAALVS